jgi:glutamine synthetase
MTNNTNQYCHKLAEVGKRYNRLAALQKYFVSNHNLTPVIGAEIEFYLSNNVNVKTLAAKIGYDIKLEKGQNQYEIDLSPTSNLVTMAKEIESAREYICFFAEELGGKADFSSRPFSDDYGSSMHIHLNFLEDDNIESYAQILCHYLPLYIKYFLPTEEDYKRLNSKFMAPTHISWGGNNRTVLIRIPDSLPRRLEHRLAAASADPAGVIFAILDSIKLGLASPEKIPQIEKTYGNAFDGQYKLVPIAE